MEKLVLAGVSAAGISVATSAALAEHLEIEPRKCHLHTKTHVHDVFPCFLTATAHSTAANTT